MSWEAEPLSPPRAAGLMQAAMGIAYCQQRSGRYAEAEAGYLELEPLFAV